MADETLTQKPLAPTDPSLVELFRQIREWQAEGRRVALATVVEASGSAPRPLGSHLAICESGDFVGSLSGGCIEGAVITEAMSVIETRQAKILDYSITNDESWAVGLSCGGSMHVWLEALY